MIPDHLFMFVEDTNRDTGDVVYFVPSEGTIAYFVLRLHSTSIHACRCKV